MSSQFFFATNLCDLCDLNEFQFVHPLLEKFRVSFIFFPAYRSLEKLILLSIFRFRFYVIIFNLLETIRSVTDTSRERKVLTSTLNLLSFNLKNLLSYQSRTFSMCM